MKTSQISKSFFCFAILVIGFRCTKTKPTVEPVANNKQISKVEVPKDPNQLTQTEIKTETPPSNNISSELDTNSTNTSQTSPSSSTSTAPTNDAPATPPTPAPEQPNPNYPVLEDCDVDAKFTEGEPVFLPENKVMITRVMSPCFTKGGLIGHRKNAGWMAMGFPCTGGEGRIDWKGTNYNRPKMVTFLLETSCAMAPSDTSKIKAEASKVLNISSTAPMIAFNPFVIQYWEIPGYEDADTSFTVDIRSGKGLDDAWIKFIKPKPLKIILFGRENAWVPGNFMYAVEGDLVWMSKNRFTFKVDTARMLKGDELNLVKTRCEALKPERECSRVF